MASVNDDSAIQPAGFLVVLSLDWIVLRASENVDEFLGESHVTLIEEPFSRFVQAQALHDLRNHFSRLSGSTGVARAYRIRLTDDRPRFDLAFQLSGGRVLLEAVPSPEDGLGEAIGSVGGLIESLAGQRGETLLKEAARRLRALTGCDRARIECGGRGAESNRGTAIAPSDPISGLPSIVTDSAATAVPIFPRKAGDAPVDKALMRAPSAAALDQLRGQGIGSVLSLPLKFAGKDGRIVCETRAAKRPNFELHAAAELFAQMLALRLEVDRLRG